MFRSARCLYPLLWNIVRFPEYCSFFQNIVRFSEYRSRAPLRSAPRRSAPLRAARYLAEIESLFSPLIYASLAGEARGSIDPVAAEPSRLKRVTPPLVRKIAETASAFHSASGRTWLKSRQFLGHDVVLFVANVVSNSMLVRIRRATLIRKLQRRIMLIQVNSFPRRAKKIDRISLLLLRARR